MSTHRITKDTNIPFPRWLWHSQIKQWIHASGGLLDKIDHLASGFTHYSTNQRDQRPEDVEDGATLKNPIFDGRCRAQAASDPDEAHLIAEACAKELCQEVGYTERDIENDVAAAIIARHNEPLVRAVDRLRAEADRLHASIIRLAVMGSDQKQFATVAEMQVAMLHSWHQDAKADAERLRARLAVAEEVAQVLSRCLLTLAAHNINRPRQLEAKSALAKWKEASA